MRNMLILTGPQGSGNHLWSKILSLHPKGIWLESLLDNYWKRIDSQNHSASIGKTHQN